MKTFDDIEVTISSLTVPTSVEETEIVLSKLREQGFAKSESISAIRRLMKISRGEATKTVHLSQAWSDVRERDDKVLDGFLEAFRNDTAK